MSPLANLAAAEFLRRKASIDQAVAANRYPRAQGERVLANWLAIALSAGARPAQCGPLLEHWQAERQINDCTARHILLEQGPPSAQWQAELARARDTAAAKARAHPTNRQTQERHLAMECLAIHLGLPAEEPLDKAA